MKGGFDVGKFLEEKGKDIKVKLPFEATGWESSKMPACADMTGIELKKKEAV